MITREQVADLQPGDVVEIHRWHWPTGTWLRGPLEVNGVTGDLRIADVVIKANVPGPDKRIAWMVDQGSTLTVVSRAPRPMYVNHPRTEPVNGDVVRNELGDKLALFIFMNDGGDDPWWLDTAADWISPAEMREKRLRLLVDGETGMPVVPDLAEAWGDGFEAGSTWTSMNPGPAGGHTDPPLNPYETGQVVQ